MSDHNDSSFGVGLVCGFSVTLFAMTILLVFAVSKTNEQWNRELVDRGIKQYNTKTGELKYVTPQDSI